MCLHFRFKKNLCEYESLSLIGKVEIYVFVVELYLSVYPILYLTRLIP